MAYNVMAFRLKPDVSEERISYLSSTLPRLAGASIAHSIKSKVTGDTMVFFRYNPDSVATKLQRTSKEVVVTSSLSSNEFLAPFGWLQEETAKNITALIIMDWDEE